MVEYRSFFLKCSRKDLVCILHQILQRMLKREPSDPFDASVGEEEKYFFGIPPRRDTEDPWGGKEEEFLGDAPTPYQVETWMGKGKFPSIPPSPPPMRPRRHSFEAAQEGLGKRLRSGRAEIPPGFSSLSSEQSRASGGRSGPSRPARPDPNKHKAYLFDQIVAKMDPGRIQYEAFEFQSPASFYANRIEGFIKGYKLLFERIINSRLTKGNLTQWNNPREVFGIIDEAIKSLQQRGNRVVNHLRQQDVQMTTLRKEHNALRQTYSVAERQLNDMTDKYNECVLKLDMQKEEVSQLEASHRRMQTQNEKFNKFFTAARNEISALQTKAGGVKRVMSTFISSGHTNLDVESFYTSLGNIILSGQQLEEYGSLVSRFVATSQGAIRQLKECLKQVGEKDRQLEKLTKTIEEQNLELQRTGRIEEELQRKILELSKGNQLLISQNDARIRDLEGFIENLKQQLTDKTTELANQDARNSKLREDLDTCQTDLQQQKMLTRTDKLEHDKCIENLQRLRGELKVKEEGERQISGELATCRRNLRNARNQNTEYQTVIANLEHDCMALGTEKENYVKELDELRSLSERSTQRMDELSRELERLHTSILAKDRELERLRGTRRQFDECTTELAMMKGETMRLTRDLQRLQTSLETKDRENRALRGSLRTLRSERDVLRAGQRRQRPERRETRTLAKDLFRSILPHDVKTVHMDGWVENTLNLFAEWLKNTGSARRVILSIHNLLLSLETVRYLIRKWKEVLRRVFGEEMGQYHYLSLQLDAPTVLLVRRQDQQEVGVILEQIVLLDAEYKSV